MKEWSEVKPRARREDLIIQEFPDETLVYDEKSHKAHCLNMTAALIWNRCNGARSVSEIRDFVAKESGKPVDESVVWLALRQLEKSHLLHTSVAPPSSAATLTRREVMKRIGIGAASLPVITTILAPAASGAGSCAGEDEECCDRTVTPHTFLSCCPGKNLSCRRLQPQDTVCYCKPGASDNCNVTICLAIPLSGGLRGRPR